jgi:hypothetical protein
VTSAHLSTAFAWASVRECHPSERLLETGLGFRIALSALVFGAIEREVAETMWRFDSREVESGGGRAPSHRRCNRQTMLHREPQLRVSREW